MSILLLRLRLFAQAVVAGWIDDNGVTSWIDDNGVTSGIDDNGVTG